MNKQVNMKQFLSSLTDTTRLRIIGLLAESEKTEIELRNCLALSLEDLRKHLLGMINMGVIRREDGMFSLDETAIKTFRNNQLHKPRRYFDPPDWLSPEDAKIIRKLADVDGSLKHLPKQLSHWMAVTRYLIQIFEPGVDYTEKQVNSLLIHFNIDTAVLRRYLVDTGKLKRQSDGSRYWRGEQS